MLKNQDFSHSLIVTTYNRPDALDLVLASIVKQSMYPLDVIVADDGSTYDTKSIVNSYSSQIKNLHHVWHEDKGFQLAAIRNKAISQCEGSFISLIDGDMFLHKDFIKTIAFLALPNYYLQGKRVLLGKKITNEFLAGNKNSVGFFESDIINRFNTIHSSSLSPLLSRKYNSIKAVKGCSMHFWKHDAFAINGFNEDFIGWGREDSEFLCRLLNHGVNRKNIVLGAVAYHLYHEEANREMLSHNDEILNDCITQKKIWCNNGIIKSEK